MSNYIVKNRDTFFKCKSLDRYMTGHKGFIAGGCFKNIFSNEKFRDVDIFFKSETDYLQAVDYYKALPEDWTFVYENKNAICYKHAKYFHKIELVKSHFGDVEETLRRFDFTVAKFAYYKHEEEGETEYKYMYNETFFEDLVNKKLVIDEASSFPVNTFERSYKYTRYGFGLCKESKIKLITMLQNVSSDDLGNDLYFGFD